MRLRIGLFVIAGMAAVLHAEGSGHTDGAVINQTLADALEWLWQGYVAK